MITRTLNSADLAIFGAPPLSARRLPLGQHNFPDWERYEARFRDIFARQYYTNHGPLAQALEARLAEKLQVRHAMCVTTASIALALSAQALGLKGKVLVPGFSFVGTAQSLAWADAEVEFCDVSRETGHLTVETVEPHLRDGVSGILGVNLWGGAADLDGLSQLAAQRQVALYFDSAHAFGCEVSSKISGEVSSKISSEAGREARNRPIGGFGRLEVISFHSANILSATEGAVICTNDDDLAAHVRNIRSNYGMGRPVPVGKTGNGRLSEAQAAIALMNLDDFPALVERNRRLYDTYSNLLDDVPGLRLCAPQGVSVSNYQNVVCEIDARGFGLSRDALLAVLDAENVTAEGARGFGSQCRRADLPNTAHWCESILQLPIGAQVDTALIERIAAVIRAAQRHASQIAGKLGV
ncbi:aminotransferase class I/II-fold pyridoxal phosphate-dependent enzyme [Paraburkholderia lacunae]|uniref:DegT/DnrJ/EryC1/StrS aminotransferase n=1 Tax=Paraburkholderia lacunae TaxID=2211104 RepID=A0A370N8C3_9BURK|nr:aminotransferase class I/II-fold pyridoxal phosphate-dependent enzyme [Paraburkholderia lacunae]RDK01841.1 DegT/DnrJ/EryC1/StrS aminotransferase [Paraburkholderia lacunae]